MLKKILSPISCAKCRVCCGFDEGDKWEIPLIFSELREEVEKKLGVVLQRRGGEYVFDMEFDGDKVVYCPAAGENGCILGELKPFDCLIWPFRVNSMNGTRVITVSPVCGTVSELPVKTLSDFVNADGFSQKLFQTARTHPDMIKPYISGYPILAVDSGSENSEKSENVN